jgi:glycosyltransferase involved in cell wall biosynthesis
MASGAAVVTNRNHFTDWLLRDGENCILTETSPTAIAESIESVCRNPSLHRRIRAGGLKTAAQYDNWTAQAEKIRQFMLQEA